MNDSQLMLQYAISALGACLVGIGWWIASELKNLADKMERVLIQMEAHDKRIERLEKQGEMNA
jgi:hypothetical protein